MAPHDAAAPEPGPPHGAGPAAPEAQARRREMIDHLRHEDRPQAAARESLDAARRALAAVQGALSGLQEALEDEDLGDRTKAAVRDVRDTIDAVGAETRDIAADPTLQRAGHAVADAATGVADAARTRVDATRQGTRERYDNVKHRAQDMRDDVREKASAVKETGVRATAAPRHIIDDMKRGLSDWSAHVKQAIGLVAGAAVLGLVAVIFFAVWVRAALVSIFGDPIGTFFAFLVFVGLAAGAYFLAQSRRTDARERMQQTKREMKDEVAYVKRPVSRTFGRERGGA